MMVQLGDRTAQGFEPMIGMHCIATLLFTELLLPNLRASAEANGRCGKTRVVWTSSPAAERFSPHNGIVFDLLNTGSKDRFQNYGASKAGTWLLSREFAHRYGQDGILSITQNPGQLKAGSYAGMPWLMMVFLKLLILYDPIFGAYTELYAGLSDDIEMGDNGAYVIPWGRIRRDEDIPRKDLVEALLIKEEGGLGYGERFWEWCEGQWKALV